MIYFVKVQDYKNREIKGLSLTASKGVKEINLTESNTTGTFELYVIREDLA